MMKRPPQGGFFCFHHRGTEVFIFCRRSGFSREPVFVIQIVLAAKNAKCANGFRLLLPIASLALFAAEAAPTAIFTFAVARIE
jgi:hypothetical protein